jgi:alpha,alpha-trehalose phosphorylase
VTIGPSDVVLDIPPPPQVEKVTQPPGCQPRRRGRA